MRRVPMVPPFIPCVHGVRRHALRASTFVLLSASVVGPSAMAQRGGLPAEAARGVPNRVLGTIDGIVSDTGLVPLQGAFVTVFGSNLRVGTGPNGRFRINKIPAGQYLLMVKRFGYRPASAVIQVPETDTLRLSYTLEPVPAEAL